MLVSATKKVGLIQDDVKSISIPTKPSTSKPHKKHKPKKQQTQAPKVPSPEPSPEYGLPSPSNDPLPGGKDTLKLKELMDLCIHLSNKVLELESEVIDIKSTSKERIEKLEGRVDRLEEENMGRIIADIEINLEEDQAKLYRIDLEYLKKNMAGYKMNYFKGMTYNEIRPLFEKYYNYNLKEVNKEVTVPEKEVEVEGHKEKLKVLRKR
nr:hypothetical protein [Tanacetum cinerariifolium]